MRKTMAKTTKKIEANSSKNRKRKSKTKKILTGENIPIEKSYAIYHIYLTNTRKGMIRLHEYDQKTQNVKMEIICGDMPDMDNVVEVCDAIYNRNSKKGNEFDFSDGTIERE